MVEANINIMDGVILGIMLLSCLVAFIRGFMREVLSLGAWVAAGVITLYCFPYVAEWLKHKVANETIATGIAALGTYMVTLIVLGIFIRILVKYAKSGADVGMLDNFLGLCFGALRGAFIVSLGFFLLTYVMDKDQYPDWIEHAVTKPYAEAGARMLAKMAPHYLEEMSSFAKENGNKMGEKLREGTDAEQSGSEGYNAKMRDNLQRMLGSSDATEKPTEIDNPPASAPAPVRYQ